jgi:hypothetical protein
MSNVKAAIFNSWFVNILVTCHNLGLKYLPKSLHSIQTYLQMLASHDVPVRGYVSVNFLGILFSRE